MVFSSIEFLYFFLPAALILHALTPKRFKNLTLLLTGLFFYAYGEPVRVILLVLVCAVNWLAGLMISEYGAGTKKARLWLILATVFSVGSLAVFKYTSFIIETVNSVFGSSAQHLRRSVERHFRDALLAFGNRPTNRDILLYVPEHVIHLRRLPQKGGGKA